MDVTMFSPVNQTVSLELQNGCKGSLRICEDDHTLIDGIYLLPFEHIEQVLVVPKPDDLETNDSALATPLQSNSQRDPNGLCVVIVPKAATGASSMRHTLPKTIVWEFPMGDNEADKQSTFNSSKTAVFGDIDSFTKTFDSLLAHHSKSTIIFDSPVVNIDTFTAPNLRFAVTLEENDEPKRPASTGALCLLPTGMLSLCSTPKKFVSKSPPIYITFESIGVTTDITVNKDDRPSISDGKKGRYRNKGPTTRDAAISFYVTESPHPGSNRAASAPTADKQAHSSAWYREREFMCFKGLPAPKSDSPRDCVPALTAYLRHHGVTYSLEEQHWNDYDKPICATSPKPLGYVQYEQETRKKKEEPMSCADYRWSVKGVEWRVGKDPY